MSESKLLMTPATQNKILAVVEKTAAEVKTGVNPSTALAKAAQAADLSREQTCRATEAYNVGKTAAVMESSEGVKRAEAFLLANPDTVISKLFPESVSKPVKSATDISRNREEDYSLTGINAMAKAASARDLGSDINDDIEIQEIPVDREALSASLDKRASKAASLSRAHSKRASERMLLTERGFRDLASYFDTHTGEYASFAKMASAIEHGPSFVNEVHSNLESPAAVKKASEAPFANREVCGSFDAVVHNFKCAVESTQLATSLADDANVIKSAAEYYRTPDMGVENYRPLGGLGAPMTDRVLSMTMGLPYLGWQSSMAKNNYTKGLEYNPYSDPEFREVKNTRNILSSALRINDLTANDDVLSAADPALVTKAYSDIFSNMPNLAKHPTLSTSAVRHLVENQDMDVQTALSLIKQEAALAKDPQNLDNYLAEKEQSMKERSKDTLAKYRESFTRREEGVAAAAAKSKEEARQAKEKALDVRNKAREKSDQTAELVEKQRQELGRLKALGNVGKVK